ncbi:ATPase [Fructobacillus pseudoficulneus]|uniref:ATPase n=1 Tax=Fructobacillus pseudoficulneus TaxID=220714 RepID=A0A3F3GVQ9_9LACO|nr:ATP-binding protein [Fructobacillus pseudoficulneus]GAP02402.1 ATPase [Fructobacillus pseudoficulneus]SEH36699.1 hypothetical protein SAMN05660469_0354 [Fructobacillus pseudoficulneus]
MADTVPTIQLGKTFYLKRPINATIDQIFAPHLLLVGQTGAGKSTTLKQISRQLFANKAGQIIFDPTGEFAAQESQQIKYILGDNVFFDLSRLNANELIAALDLHWDNSLADRLSHAQSGLRIARYILAGQETLWDGQKHTNAEFFDLKEQLFASQWDYPLHLLAQQMQQDLAADQAQNRLTEQQSRNCQQEINRLADRLSDPRLKTIAPNQDQSKTKYDLVYLLQLAAAKANYGAKITINLAQLKELGPLQAAIMSAAWQQLLLFQTKANKKKAVYLLIDEGHRFLTADQEDRQNGLAQILREGRKEQLFVAFASQSPLDLPPALLGQFSTLICHRLVNPAEWRQLPLLWPTVRLTKKIARLETGQALIKLGRQKEKFGQIEL